MTIENSYLCGYLKIKGLTEVSQPLHQVRCSKAKFDPFSEGTCWKQAESGTCRFETNLRLSRPAPPLWHLSVNCIPITFTQHTKGNRQTHLEVNAVCGRVRSKMQTQLVCLQEQFVVYKGDTVPPFLILNSIFFLHDRSIPLLRHFLSVKLSAARGRF